MTRRHVGRDHLEWLPMRRVLAVSVVAAVLMALFATAAVADLDKMLKKK